MTASLKHSKTSMVDSCGDVESIQGWMRCTRMFFPHCLARATKCNVDEILWPGRDDENAAGE